LLSTCPLFLHHTSTTAISTLSLHDALPIWKTLKVQSHIRLAVQSMLQPVLFRAADLFMKKPQSPFWGTAAFFLYYSTSLNGRPEPLFSVFSGKMLKFTVISLKFTI